MIRKIYATCALFFLVLASYSQVLQVDAPGTNTPSEMVSELLSSSCVEYSNVSISSNQSVAKFNASNTAFPFSEGIILRTGEAGYTAGAYTGNNLSTEVNQEGDTNLEELYLNLSGSTKQITDVAYLEFDFVPVFNTLEFDFIFASNEYGEFQCSYGDVFAFYITDLTTNESTNLAVLPGTDTPVSAASIRDSQYNVGAGCVSQNPELFSTYNVDNPSQSFMNMRGFTNALKASAAVVPNRAYKIRMVIGDVFDYQFDSAVFIKAGSFDMAVDIWEDTEICSGDVMEISTGFDPATYNHEWSLDGTVLPNESAATLSVNQAGTYSVALTKNGSACLINDQIIISELLVSEPQDIELCYTGDPTYEFDLRQNDEMQMGVNQNTYKVYYFSQPPPINVSVNDAIPQSQVGAYTSAGNETIYVKLLNKVTTNFCDAVYEFDLLVNQGFTIGVPDDFMVCDDGSGAFANLTTKNTEILDELTAAEYTVSYYASAANEQNNIPIQQPENYVLPSNVTTQTIWVRVTNNQSSDCYEVTSFQLEYAAAPTVVQFEDVTVCSAYELPPLDSGNYYDAPGGPNGTGELLLAGSLIEESGTYYISSEPNLQGCFTESSFMVTVVDEYDIGLEYCGSFSVPYTEVGEFYTAAGGPTGGGELLPFNTILTESQTVYYYAMFEDVFCTEKQLDLVINPLPPVDELEDVVLCAGDVYTLPPLPTSGNNYVAYGQVVSPGYEILETTEISIFSDNGTCGNISTFNVTFVSSVNNVIGCGFYVLPFLPVGNYYTQPMGQGDVIPAETAITASQTVYVYSELASCTNNLSFDIRIEQIPELPALVDVRLCEDESYILPALDNGNYYTGEYGSGEQLLPGTIINESQTVYAFAQGEFCFNQVVFEVEIREKPLVDSFTSIFTCDPFELPELTNGAYYTQSGGQGEQLFPGDIIDETMNVYIYNSYEDIEGCYNETFFRVDYLEVSLGDGNFEDVYSCDYYLLPALGIGNYYTLPNGQGNLLPANTLIEATQTVYAFVEETDERNYCFDEEEILITISKTPILPSFDDVAVCGSYELPVLDSEETLLDTALYDIKYFREPNGQDEITEADYVLTTVGAQTVYVRAVSKTNSDCFAEISFEVDIYPLLELELEDQFLCVDASTNKAESTVLIPTKLSPQEFDVFWYLDGQLVGQGINYETDIPGVYTVETIKKTADIVPNCGYSDATVEVVILKTIASVSVSEDFADNATITVDVEDGYGTYEYKINDEEYQDSPYFENLFSGKYQISVRNTFGGCSELTFEVNVLNHIDFFTPNQDGINDTWNISELKDDKYEATISIFNRYYQLLAVIQPSGYGWDGTFNGADLPEDDYWFTVEYVDDDGFPQQFRSHFSLKR